MRDLYDAQEDLAMAWIDLWTRVTAETIKAMWRMWT